MKNNINLYLLAWVIFNLALITFCFSLNAKQIDFAGTKNIHLSNSLITDIESSDDIEWIKEKSIRYIENRNRQKDSYQQYRMQIFNSLSVLIGLNLLLAIYLILRIFYIRNKLKI